MKKISLKLIGLLIACSFFSQTALAQNTALENYFAQQGLVVTKPLWQKMELINKDQRFLYQGQDYVFNNWADGLILEFDQAEKWEAVVQLTMPDGQLHFYQQEQQVWLDNAAKGQYILKLEKSLAGAVGLNIYAAHYTLPLDKPLILTADFEDYLNLRTNVEKHLSNGGIIINVGSQQINSWAQEILGEFETINLEGESAAISKFSDYYFYIPGELFGSEDQAGRAVKYLQQELENSSDLQEMGLLFLIFAIIVLLAYLVWDYRKQFKKIFAQIEKNFLKNAAVTISALIIVFLVLAAVGLYLYQNYSGLDLFPNFKISDFLEQWNVKIMVLMLVAVALLILLFSVKGVKIGSIAAILLAAIVLSALPAQTEISPREELIVALTSQQPINYPISAGQEVKGVLTLRNKNEQFANKSFYLNLLDETGQVIASQFFSIPNELLGSPSKEYQLPFVFDIAGGNYLLQLENSDPNRSGDYELLNVQLEST